MNRASEPQPRLVLFAGPNGSGKSTLTRAAAEEISGIFLPPSYINADDIAHALKQEMPLAPDEEREREAFKRARVLRQKYRAEKTSFAFETVFSHPSTLLDIQKCKAAGFHVTLIYVSTENPEINVERVARRVRSGGHGVPADKIRSRYVRSLHLLPRAVEEADEALIYDATDRTRLCLRKQATGQVRTVALPDYIVNSLYDPLNIRAAERRQVEEQFSPLGEIHYPDEENGSYFGVVRCHLRYYGLQEILADAYCRHDLSLLEYPLPEQERLHLRYKDGVCTAAITATASLS